jgi:hypothetical protein
VFLVERYLPAAAAGNLASSVARAAQLCALSAQSGPASKVHLFRAATAEAVPALDDEASFALDRIAVAVQVYPVTPAPDQP